MSDLQRLSIGVDRVGSYLCNAFKVSHGLDFVHGTMPGLAKVRSAEYHLSQAIKTYGEVLAEIEAVEASDMAAVATEQPWEAVRAEAEIAAEETTYSVK